MRLFEQVGDVVDTECGCQLEGHARLHVAGELAVTHPDDVAGLRQLERGGDPQFVDNVVVLSDKVPDEIASFFAGRSQLSLLREQIERGSGGIIGRLALLLLQKGHLVSPDRQARQGLEGRRVDVLADGYLELALGEVGVLWFALAHTIFLGLPPCGTTGLVGCLKRRAMRRYVGCHAPINTFCLLFRHAECSHTHQDLRSPQVHVTMTMSGTQHVPNKGGP